ncbi:MAG: GNAT family N-acetyltransferase [Anaerolineales bacterium]|jgi:ribosomal-protein-alanine N-acetyltransferase
MQPGRSANIQPATWRDLNAIRHLERVCFPIDAWPIWDMVGVMTLPNVIRLKAMKNGQITGFIAGDVRPSQNMAWIATIAVLPEYRQQGIGSALLRACEEKITQPRVRLSVRASNEPAIRLYKKNGYKDVGLWSRYYYNGEDAIVLEKKLPRHWLRRG